MRTYLTLYGRALSRFGADKCMSFAAAISYYALFSIFPLLLFVISVLGFFVHGATQRESMVNALVAFLGPDIGRTTITTQVDAFAGGRRDVGAIGLVISIWSASAVFGAIRTGLNAAWDIEHPEAIVPRKLRDLATVIAIGCLVLLSIALTGVLTAVEGYGSHLIGQRLGTHSHLLSTSVALVAPPFVAFAAFGAMYYMIPQVRIQLRDVWLGALTAAVLFEAAQLAFGFYVTHFAHYDRLYGPLGAVIALLFFMYISANILLIGGEVTRAQAEARLAAPSPDQPDMTGLRTSIHGRLLGIVKSLFVAR